MIVLNISTDILTRLKFVQRLFNESAVINASFTLTRVSLIVDPDKNISSIRK